MSQVRSTKAVDQMSANNPTQLGDNQTIVENADGSVVLSTTVKVGQRDRTTSRRVDSNSDRDHATKGGKIWWKQLIKQQAARDKAEADAEAKAEVKKPAAGKKGDK